MTAYIYLRDKFEPIFTVGFYDPRGQWTSESDHDSPEKAAERVHWLNGGEQQGYLRALADTQPRIDALVAALQRIAASDSPLGEPVYGPCPWCTETEPQHTAICPVQQARAALKREGKE